MLLKVFQPIYDNFKSDSKTATPKKPKNVLSCLDPAGKKFDQKMAESFFRKKSIW